jgi:hypothetical protein
VKQVRILTQLPKSNSALTEHHNNTTDIVAAPRALLSGSALQMLNTKEAAICALDVDVSRRLFWEAGGHDGELKLEIQRLFLQFEMRMELIFVLVECEVFDAACGALFEPPLTTQAVHKLLVYQLKERLQQRGINSDGKRKELLERLHLAVAEECAARGEVEELEQEMLADGDGNELEGEDDKQDAKESWDETKDGDMETQQKESNPHRTRNRQCLLLLEGACEFITHNCNVFSAKLSLTGFSYVGAGAAEITSLLSCAQVMVDACAALQVKVAAPALESAEDWALAFNADMTSLRSAIQVVRKAGLVTLRHKANQVEFTDGGGGVGIKQQCVQLANALFLIISGGTSSTRKHNAANDSRSQFAEQSISTIQEHTSPRSATLLDNIAGFHGCLALSPKDLVTADLSGLTVAAKEAAMDAAYKKTRWFVGQLQNVVYDRSPITALVYRDPEETNAYTPLFPDWFETLFNHGTASACSASALAANPLCSLVTEMRSFLLAHSHVVPGIGLQIRVAWCGAEGMPTCVFERHVHSEMGHGGTTTPPLYYPIPYFDNVAQQLRYYRSTELCKKMKSKPLDEWCVVNSVPLVVIARHVEENLPRWY